MPDLNISIPHKLSQDEAQRRIQAAIADARKEHAARIQNLQESWNGYAGTLNVSVMGQQISAQVTVNPSDVTVHSSLPLIASMFRGAIEDAIRKQGAALLA
jgi:hypothetical protein